MTLPFIVELYAYGPHKDASGNHNNHAKRYYKEPQYQQPF
jgi:hypothetical protein